MIFKREFKVNLKGLIIWTSLIVLMCVVVVALYPEISSQQDMFESLIESMGSFLKALGIEEVSMDSILNYYSLEGYIMVALFGGIYAALLGSSILSKEQSEKSIEFLLSKPVKRSTIVVQKYATVVLNIFIFNMVLLIANLITFNIFKEDEFSYSVFFLIHFAPLMLHLTLASLSFVSSIFIKKSRSAIYTAMGIVFVLYFIDIIAALASKLEFLKHFSPFQYTKASTIIRNGQMEPRYIFIMFVVIAASFVTSIYLFERKDITV